MATNPVFVELSPEKLLALAAYGEARGEGKTGMQAVINTIMNRSRYASRYADNSLLPFGKINAVILKSKQFSAFNPSDPNEPVLESIAEKFDSVVKTNKNLKTAYDLAKKAKDGALEDITNGATHYHTAAIKPSWTKDLTFLGKTGNHLFYRNSWEQAIQVAKNPVTWGFIFFVGLTAYWLLKR